jgi:hypothetical protein
MPRTIRAARATQVLSLIVLSILGLAQGVPQVLDLTKQVVPENRSIGFPGQSVGGVVGLSRQSPGYKLPISLKIMRIQLKGESANVELQVTNSGTQYLAMPSCLDGRKAFQAGAINHRSMEFGFDLEAPSGHISEVVEVTFGSSVPNCLIMVEPNHSLLIIMQPRLNEQLLEKLREAPGTLLRAFAREITLEDSRYFVKGHSVTIESQPAKPAS